MFPPIFPASLEVKSPLYPGFKFTPNSLATSYFIFSNEVVDQYKTFKSTYLGNVIKNEGTNINNTINNTKMNENNYTTTNNEKTKGNEKESPKKSENIIFINNGTFMNDRNSSSNKKLTLNLAQTIERMNSLKIDTKKQNFEIPKEYNKIFTYAGFKQENKAKVSASFRNNKSINSNGKNNSSYSKSKNGEPGKNDISNQKILDNSSISLLNNFNKSNNLYAKYNGEPAKEIPFLNSKKNIGSISPKSPTNYKTHKKKKKFSIIDNISQNSYSDIETGKTNISIEFLIQLADLYNVSTDYILERKK